MDSIQRHKGAKSVLSYYEGNLVEALVHLFPEIGIDVPKFVKMPRKYWEDHHKQRELFIGFAKTQGFDPLVCENWYSANYEALYHFKGIRSVLVRYNGSIVKALLSLFPNVGLDKRKLHVPDKFWANSNNQRRFFITFAKERNFDPLVAENWYTETPESIVNSKGARSLLAYHGGSVTKALSTLFPHIGLNRNKFKRKLAIVGQTHMARTLTTVRLFNFM